MPEAAARVSASTVHASSPVRATGPRAAPVQSAPAWSAASRPLPASVQLGSAVSAAPQSVGGEPLRPGIRSTLEGSFGVDLGSVRVHSDARAQTTASALSARAFTFGNNIFLGPSERSTDLRLIAHETSHVVQQQAAPMIQRWSPQQSDRFEWEAQRASTAAELGQSFTVQERTSSPRVQRLGLSDILDGLANLAANVPGFTLLTVIIGRNPINMRTVERNFTNILRGFMGLIPGGEILFQVLNRYGVVERLGSWVSDQVNSLGITYDYLRSRFTAFTDSLSWTDIFSPGDVWRRAQAIFTEPITRISNFVARLISQAITWLKETFMQPLSEFCRQIPGYTLVTVLLGRDPFTNASVPRTALNVVRAFAEFIPGGTERVNQLVESRALQRAYEWFVQETQARNLTWDRVTGTFAQAWNSLSLEDVLHPIDTLQRIGNIFRPLMGDLISFAGAALMKLLEFIFEAVMGAGGARILAILKRARATFLTIIQNPVGFLRNLLGAVGQGVRQFMTNILQHLQQGVIAWLTGPVARAGIQMPERWDLRGIIWFVLQILGLTWARVREKLVRLLGERVVAGLEAGFQLLRDIRERGLVQALRDRVTEFFGQLRDAALGSIRSFIQQRLVMAGITQLLSLLNPVGAIIQAIIKTYTTIQFFIQRINQILDLVESIVNSIAAIASGAIGQAASFVERTMARTIPIILDFLARFIGLGDVGAQVQATIRNLQARVDQMLDRAVDWIAVQARRIGQLVARGARNVAASVRNVLGLRRTIRNAQNEQHTLFFQQQGGRVRLMMATTPAPFSSWIVTLPATSSDRYLALHLMQNIENWEQDTLTTNVDHQAQIEQALDELGRIVLALMQPPASRHLPSYTGPTFSGTYNGFGRGMRVTIETSDPKIDQGSAPQPPNLPIWNNIIWQRLLLSGGAAYYRLGHLLNQRLGGTGLLWENLTPLSTSGNSAHFQNAERLLTDRRSGSVRTNANTARAGIYVVTPAYGRPRNMARITEVNNATGPSWTPARKAFMLQLLQAEQFVPTMMIGSFREALMSRETGRIEWTTEITFRAVNDIDDDKLENYNLRNFPGGPKSATQ